MRKKPAGACSLPETAPCSSITSKVEVFGGIWYLFGVLVIQDPSDMRKRLKFIISEFGFTGSLICNSYVGFIDSLHVSPSRL